MFNSIVVRKNPALFLTAAVAVVIIMLLLVRSVSAAAGDNASPDNQGNQQVLTQIALVQQQISDFQSDMSTRLNTVDATLSALQARVNLHDTDVGALISIETDEVDGAIVDLSTLTSDHGTEVSSLIATETQEIDDSIDNLSNQLGDHDTGVGDLISTETLEIDAILTVINETTDGHANPSPFTVTANTCATFGGGASVGGELSGGMKLGATGSIGAEAAGNGVKAESRLQGSLMANLALQGGVDIVHSVCNSGLYVTSDAKDEDDYTANQQNIVDDYGDAAYALQSHNEGYGGPLASNIDAPQDVFSLASQMGINISDIVPSLNALIDLDGLPDNPAALVTGDSELNDLLDVFDFAESVDTSGMLDAFTDPCASLSGLGSTAAAICDDPSPSLESILEELQGTVDGIETVVGEIDTAVDDVVTPALAEIQETVNSINGLVDDFDQIIDESITSSLTQIQSAISGMNGTVNGISGDVNQVYRWLDPEVKWSVGGIINDAWDCITVTGRCGNGW